MKLNWLNDEARTVLNRRYLKDGVSAEERYLKIAQTIENISGIVGIRDRFVNYIENGWVSFATPVLKSFGEEDNLPISCNKSVLSDNLHDILMGLHEVGMLSKYGAGTSVNFSNIRPLGSKISTGGESEGIMPFISLYEEMINKITQSSTRRGMTAVYLSVDHPEIMDFLNIRSDGFFIKQVLPAVTIPYGWMDKLKAGDMNKRKIWSKILKMRSEFGTPYILFLDNVNDNKPEIYKQKNMDIITSNLCVAPETLLLTRYGNIPIGELEDSLVEVWNGKQWSETIVKKTGENQKLVTVVLSDGKELDCTLYHKWYTVKDYNDQYKNILTEKRTHELKIGDKLCKFDTPVIDGTEDFKSPYTHGLYCADGTNSMGRKQLALYGEKKDLVSFLDIQRDNGEDAAGRRNLVLKNDIAEKFTVPLQSSVEIKLLWLAGLFDGDGTIARNGTNESIQIASVEPVFLKEVQILLQSLGVQSKISFVRESGEYLLPDGRGGLKSYKCKDVYRLLISSNGLYKLSCLGFRTNRLKFNERLPQRNASKFVTVVDVIDNGRYDDTYCVNEPLEHKAVFNGILTGNCNEIAEYCDEEKTFACCLSSVNLYYYDDFKNHPDFIFDMNIMLDCVISEYIEKGGKLHGLEKSVKFAEEHRAIGLGVLGLHSYFQKHMLPFSSLKSFALNNEIFKFIRKESDRASRWMAENWGEPEIMKGTGYRNSTRMAIAPTKTTSFIMGQHSLGIEPIKSNFHEKEIAGFSSSYKNPKLKEVLESYNSDTETVWDSIAEYNGSVQHLSFLSDDEKNVFRTFWEVSQIDIVKMAGQRQQYIDQGQSLNLMFHPKTPAKDINNITLEAHSCSVKGLYYQYTINEVREFNREWVSCSSCEG